MIYAKNATTGKAIAVKDLTAKNIADFSHKQPATK